MKIGDKVVCVDDSNCKKCGVAVAIKSGNVYVIQSFYIDECNELGLVLIGVSQHNESLVHKPKAFSSARFRLLEYLKERNAVKETKYEIT